MRIKICGIQSCEDIVACVDAGVDAVGFVFAAGPRQVTIDQAAVLSALLPPYVTSVGVFADNSEPQVREAVRRCRLDVLQFSDGMASRWCGSFGKPTIAVVHVGEADELADVPVPSLGELAQARAAGLMVDTRVQGARGGTGSRVSTPVAAALARSSPLPFILAGGLSPENVSAAAVLIKPWGVDVSSSVEVEGKKDRSRIEQFVRAARRHIV
jgi:phosphoribosylanthranilate isomerase